MAGRKRNPAARLVSFLLRWSGLLCVPGGVLWALSPVGVTLSEQLFHTPNVFWKMFPAAPLLLLLGLIGLHFRVSDRSGRLEVSGFLVCAIGLLLTLIGDVAEFWLRLDESFIMTAPGYRALRLGLIVFAAGSILFGVAVGRDRSLPIWGALPFAIASLCGLLAVVGDLDRFGALLWILFGLGWVWLGLALLARGLSLAFEKPGRPASPTAGG